MLATTVCGEQGKFGGGTTGPAGDAVAPVASILLPGGATDTVVNIADSLKFTAKTTDNVAVASMKVELVGVGSTFPDTVVLDTTTTTTVVAVQKSFVIPITAARASGDIRITVTSTDAAGNSGADSVTVALSVPPSGAFTPPLAGGPRVAGDSILVQFQAQDLSGLDSVRFYGFALRGVKDLGTDTIVTRYASKMITLPAHPTDTTLERYLYAIPTDSTAEKVYIQAIATDAAGNNTTVLDSVTIVAGPYVSIARPTANAVTSPGKKLIVEVHANTKNGVAVIGYRISGVMTAQDSTIRTTTGGSLADSAVYVDTVTVGPTLGQFTVVAFATDSLGEPSGIEPGVPVTVQSSAADVTPPAVNFTVDRRVEVDDSINVTASDAGGIKSLGWTATKFGSATVIAGDSITGLPGTLSDVNQNFGLNLPGPPSLPFPSQVVVTAFAVDSVGNRATTSTTTLTVVAGKTYALPAGSQIGDAIYNANRKELYLTNTALDEIEVFSLTSNSFVASVPVGSRPVGIALWPHDTLGTYGDTVVVANSGGTNLSVVDMVARREVRRFRLPDYVVETVKTATSSGGGLDLTITVYEFSDRPLYLGMTCITSGSANCANVRAVYSTTPTPAQSVNGGYVAWADLLTTTPAPHYHMLYEHTNTENTTDSLQIIAAFDSIPGQQLRDTILGAGVGAEVAISDLLFNDTTFVRNSGDFNHVLIGEGGQVAYARALTYDARQGLGTINVGGSCTVAGVPLNCTGTFDRGVTTVYVSDLVVNRAARVTSIATNFNGRTNLVRADSIYAFDFVLRLTGLIQVSGAATGMDFTPANNFDAATRGTGGLGGNGSPNNRLVFAARPDSSIDVFDTYFYGRVTDTTSTASAIPIPIRNALIGPVRVADVSGSTSLFGVTASGLVVVTLPGVNNSLFPTRRVAGGP